MEDHINGSRNYLTSLEWIFSTKEKGKGDFIPEYGDLSLLNRDGLILKAVGKKQLTEIASEYMDLLESSSAIYERNGDYALGIFSSGWCRMMDAASRKLCDTDDNRIALESGMWLCHESCWKDASLKAMQEGIPADIECSGGIHLYAVPLRAGGEIVGAINFGYGDPPREEAILKNLSLKYDIPVQQLRAEAKAYQPRPTYIIDYAKKRIQKVAVYLGYIIERWLAEQSVRQSEYRFRELFQNMISCVAIYKAVDEGADFEFLDFNRAGERVEQISRDQVIGKRVTQVFPGVIDFGLFDVFKRVWKTGVQETHPVSQYQDGRITGWRENVVFKLPSGELVALYNDLTEQKQSEERLRISEEKFRTVFETANVGKSLTLPTGEINANQSLCDMLGYTAEELGRKTWQEVTPTDEIASIGQKIAPLLRGEKGSVRFNKRYIHKNGSIIWGDVSVTMRYDDQGNPLHFITTIVDISEQIRVEKELRTLKKELELKIEEKTNDLKMRIDELERFHSATIEREFRIKELQDEIDRLKKQKAISGRNP
ncbi:MAG: PAS domain S-box protein [Bacteroidales bacterium]|nr:PAS domain S-box protein [Bacteroidales bacterium]